MRILRSLDEQSAWLDRRKRELAIPLGPMPELRNSGRRRTPEKRALLARLDEVARMNRREPLPAKY